MGKGLCVILMSSNPVYVTRRINLNPQVQVPKYLHPSHSNWVRNLTRVDLLRHRLTCLKMYTPVCVYMISTERGVIGGLDTKQKVSNGILQRFTPACAAWLVSAFSCPFTSRFPVETPAALSLSSPLYFLNLLKEMYVERDKNKARWEKKERGDLLTMFGPVGKGYSMRPSGIDYTARNGWCRIALWQFDLLIFYSGQLMVALCIMITWLFSYVKSHI